MNIINYNGVDIDLDAAAAAQGGKTPVRDNKTVNKSFDGIRALDLEGLHASITVRPNTGNRTTVSITGPEDVVEAVKMTTECRGNHTTLKVRAENVGNAANIFLGSGINIGRQVFSGNTICQSIGFGRGNTIIQTDGNTTIISGGNGGKLTIDITLPNQAEVSIDGCQGNIDISSALSYLYAHIGGSGTVRAEETHELNVSISGSGDLEVKKASGNVKLKISGSGSAKIHEGEVDDLDVSISGQGNVRAAVTAKNADLSVSGMGSILVNDVTGHVRRRVTGMGSINVIREYR